jgi:hypothetical protein
MTTRLLVGAALICGLAVAQQPADPERAPEVKGKTAPRETEALDKGMESGAGAVTVNPAQPFRPIPASGTQPRESIWEFYLKAPNPREIRWGDEIDRCLAVLAEQSIGNPYFRVCAFQTGLILVLLLICWLWWDKTREIKWAAAECLTDTINAKRIADQRALEAIDRHNRHIEMCNRVIEGQDSGVGGGQGAADWQREIRDLQTQLATERTQSARLDAELKKRDEFQAQLERRLAQMESVMGDRQNGASSELVARLQRAEAELGRKKTGRR